MKRLVILCCILFFSPNLFAATKYIEQSIQASTCVVDESQRSKVNVSANEITYKSGQYGEVKIYCRIPMSYLEGSGFNLMYYGMNYTDSTGTGTTANIKAEYRYGDLRYGQNYTLSTIDSNSYSNTSLAYKEKSISKTFGDHDYQWAQVFMNRNSGSSATVSFRGIRIYGNYVTVSGNSVGVLNQNYNPGTCRVRPQDLSKVDIQGNAMTFASGQTGTIEVYCPIRVTSVSRFVTMKALGLSYIDSTGQAYSGRVKAKMMKTCLKTGGCTPSSFGTISSDSYTNTGFTYKEISMYNTLGLGDTVWVSVELYRDSTSESVWFRGLYTKAEWTNYATPYYSLIESGPGSGCTIQPDSENLLEVVDDYVQFKSGQTGEAKLYCPLNLDRYHSIGANLKNLEITIVDNMASGDNGYLKTKVKTLDLESPFSENTVLEVDGVGSSSSRYLIYDIVLNEVPVDYKNAIWLEVSMKRESTSTDMRYYGQTIYSAIGY